MIDKRRDDRKGDKEKEEKKKEKRDAACKDIGKVNERRGSMVCPE